MTTTSLSKLLGSAALFLTLAIRSTALAETTDCKQGICCHAVETIRDGKAAKAIWFTGFPRAGDYVTNFYQVLGLPNSNGVQVEIHPGTKNYEQFVVPRTSTISVQACRLVTSRILPSTECTGWIKFTVEVAPGGAGSVLGGVAAAAKETAGSVVPAPVPPAGPPKVVVHTGKAKNQAPTDAAGSGNRTSSKDAAIMAAPTMVNIPAGQSEGTTQIYWNAGEAHPYAEVWVKVGDEDPKHLLEKGKGSTAMKVRPGRNVFILTDAGEELATVTVTGK